MGVDLKDLHLKGIEGGVITMKKTSFYHTLCCLLLLLACIIPPAHSHAKDVSLIQQPLDILSSDKNYTIKHTSTREFQIYFDTPDFKLRNNNAYLVYQAKEYISQAKKKKKISRIIRYKYNSLSDIASRNYNRVKDIYDKHQLFFLVKRDVRKGFLEQLQKDGIKIPLIIKHMFSTAKNTETYTISYKKQKMFTIEQTYYISHVENMQFVFTSLFFKEEQALDENKKIRNSLQTLKKSIAEKVPQAHLINNSDNEYLFIYEQIKAQMRSIDYFLQYRDLYNFIMAILISIIGLAIIKLLFWKRIF